MGSAIASGIKGGTPLSRWGKPVESLREGSWVMEGNPTLKNYILSFKWDFISPTNKVAKFSQSQSFIVPSNSLRYSPKNSFFDEAWKGFFFNQKIYNPTASGIPVWILDAGKSIFAGATYQGIRTKIDDCGC